MPLAITYINIPQITKDTAARNAFEKTIEDLNNQLVRDNEDTERLKKQLSALKIATDSHISDMEIQARRDQEEILALKRRAADEKLPLDSKIATLDG